MKEHVPANFTLINRTKKCRNAFCKIHLINWTGKMQECLPANHTCSPGLKQHRNEFVYIYKNVGYSLSVRMGSALQGKRM